MDDQFTTREQIRDEVISIISDMRISQGLDPIHLDDNSPLFSKGMERGGQKDVDLLSELESEFGVNISDDPATIEAISTIGELSDFIMERMHQSYG